MLEAQQLWDLGRAYKPDEMDGSMNYDFTAEELSTDELVDNTDGSIDLVEDDDQVDGKVIMENRGSSLE